MKRKRIAKTVIITSIILLIGGTIAFAHSGWGYGGQGHHMRDYGGRMMGPGYGGGPMEGYGPRWGQKDQRRTLSEEDAAKLEETRERFYTETKELRRKIRDLEIDIRDEMDNDDPDSGKLSKIQKELSRARAEFDQKALEHRLEMRKLVPEEFRKRGYGRGGYCRR